MPLNLNIILITFALIFIFYVLIPGVGAVTTLERWRKFRKNLTRISMYPIVGYSKIALAPAGRLGTYRFFGTIESIHGENRVWLRNESVSVEADLANVSLYFLPSQATESQEPLRFGEILKNAAMSAKWKRIFSLPEGTRVFIGGMLFSENGRGVFKSEQKEELVAVIYDGDERTILRRAIWSGRQKNEYWNQFTLISLITGFFALLFFSYLLVRNPLLRLEMLFAIAVSLLPVALYMPPGVGLYFLYRLFWNRSRLLRRERDMLRLPTRWFSREILSADRTHEIISLPDGSAYIMARSIYANEKHLVLEKNRSFLKTSLKAEPGKHAESYLFGAYIKIDDSERIGVPADPMADYIEIEGNPEVLAEICQRRSKVFAAFAAFFIFFDIAVNFAIIFVMLRYFLR